MMKQSHRFVFAMLTKLCPNNVDNVVFQKVLSGTNFAPQHPLKDKTKNSPSDVLGYRPGETQKSNLDLNATRQRPTCTRARHVMLLLLIIKSC